MCGAVINLMKDLTWASTEQVPEPKGADAELCDALVGGPLGNAPASGTSKAYSPGRYESLQPQAGRAWPSAAPPRDAWSHPSWPACDT